MFARMKTLSMVLCLVVVCLTLAATAMASDFDKKDDHHYESTIGNSGPSRPSRR